MAITAQDVNKLRQLTGAGMMDCKKALTEADGNFDEAVVILRKKGQKVSAARADRETTEGSVFIKTNENNSQSTMVGLGCETDFVAKNDDFQALGNAILNAASTSNATTVEEVKSLMVEGRSVEEHITDMIGKIGEKIDIVGFAKFDGEYVASYRHFNGKIGVLVQFEGVNGADLSEIGTDVALQVAAMKPIAVDKDDVDADTILKEREIGMELARTEGKPENMLEKIAEGRLQKFFKENTLMNQESLSDSSKSIRQMLEAVSKTAKVVRFSRVAI